MAHRRYDDSELKVIYQHYTALWQRACERARDRLRAIAPETGGHDQFVHNWHRCALGTDREQPHSRAAVALSDRMRHFTGYVLRRRERECSLAQHREHIADGEVGRYLWCYPCQGEELTYEYPNERAYRIQKERERDAAAWATA